MRGRSPRERSDMRGQTNRPARMVASLIRATSVQRESKPLGDSGPLEQDLDEPLGPVDHHVVSAVNLVGAP
jgi:hypothetical protein